MSNKYYHKYRPFFDALMNIAIVIRILQSMNYGGMRNENRLLIILMKNKDSLYFNAIFPPY